MLQESTKGLLIKIVQLLEITDEVGWDDQIEFGKECLYEMHQMTRPSYRAYRTDSTRRVSSSLRHPAWEFTDYLPLYSRRISRVC